jgi:toxin ParE1/3/4
MSYKLTRLAEEQLIECYLFGHQHYGEERAERYLGDIQSCFELLSNNPKLARIRKEYGSALRVHHHKRHYVAYIIEDGTNNILVLSVLHDSMDLAQHLGQSEP